MKDHIGSFQPKTIIAGNEKPVLTKGVVLAKGQGVLPAGTVLGISESGIATPVDSEKEDGSQLPDCILADPVDTDNTTDNPRAAAYKAGIINESALVFSETEDADEIAAHKDKLRDLGIFLIQTI